jgi:hypothetical protein
VSLYRDIRRYRRANLVFPGAFFGDGQCLEVQPVCVDTVEECRQHFVGTTAADKQVSACIAQLFAKLRDGLAFELCTPGTDAVVLEGRGTAEGALAVPARIETVDGQDAIGRASGGKRRIITQSQVTAHPDDGRL